MKRAFPLLPSLVLYLFQAALTAQAAPLASTFTYQGHLSQNGIAATGAYDLQFILRDAAVTGAQVGAPISLAPVGVTNGLFTVMLDFGSAAFDGNARWLEIGVRTNGSIAPYQVLEPAQPLTATPYALLAGTASTYNGKIADSQLSGNIPRLNSNVTFTGAVQINNPGSSIAGSFFGNGAGVTNVHLVTANSDGAITWTTNSSLNFVFDSAPMAGLRPGWVTTLDINGDGHMDLVTADHGTNTLTVLTNDGRGRFSQSFTLTVDLNPYAVLATDINGDNKQDLVSVNDNFGSLSILTNNGTGGFVLASKQFPGAQPSSVVATDLNGDGKPDLVVANQNDHNVAILTNSGAGNFHLSSLWSVGHFPFTVLAVDVNGDNKLDLVTANLGDNTLTVLTNSGFGTYQLSSSPNVGKQPIFAASGDFNRDGWVDLVSANFEDNTLTVLTNDHSGAFGLAANLAVGTNPKTVTASDLNGDGSLDLITADLNSRSLTLLTNDGKGSFILATSLLVEPLPHMVATTDVNNDGTLDLIVAFARSNSLMIFFDTPLLSANFNGGGKGLTSLNAQALMGTIPPSSLNSLPAENLTGMLSDARLSGNVALLSGNQAFRGQNTFNNPGNAFFGNGRGLENIDLLTSYSAGAISWTTNANIRFMFDSSPSVGLRPVWLAAADINGDGRLDIISADHSTNTLTVLTNTGTGRFVHSSTLTVGMSPYAVLAADINNDGKLDLISVNDTSGSLVVLTNNGRGDFITASTAPTGLLPSWAVAADLNGDNKLDVISANQNSHSLSILTNNGRAGLDLSSSVSVGQYPFSVSAVDANGDGKLDLITANYGDNTLSILTNNGRGNFVLASSPRVGLGPIFATASDVNSDGWIDMITANWDENSLTILTNSREGHFEISATLRVGTNPKSVTAADLNGDGKPDLISSDLNSSTLTIWTNRGDGNFLFASSLPVEPFPHATVAADVDGDGKLDLIVGYSHGNSLTVLRNIASVQASFRGDGSGLTGLNASNLIGSLPSASLTSVPAENLTGTISDARLSGNVAMLNVNQTFTGENNLSNVGNHFAGDGSRLTGLSGTNLANASVSASKLGPDVGVWMNAGTNLYYLSGRVGIGKTNPATALDVNGDVTASAFKNKSDRNLKENLTEVSPREVLERVTTLPITRWNFKGEATTPHLGPMAQDFHAAFGLGSDDRHIASVDADGVALAAIKGLKEIIEEQKKELEALRKRVEELERKGISQ